MGLLVFFNTIHRIKTNCGKSYHQIFCIAVLFLCILSER